MWGGQAFVVGGWDIKYNTLQTGQAGFACKVFICYALW